MRAVRGGGAFEVKGAIGGGRCGFRFPELVSWAANQFEDALAQMPVFVGIAQPPQQMPARLKGAG
jgi:hypothetical protein